MLFLGFICDEQYYDELVAYGGFPPFDALRHHLPPTEAVGLWMLDNVPYSSIEKSR